MMYHIFNDFFLNLLLQIKYVIILYTIFISVQSQRPPFAGNSKSYPGVLPQYLEEQKAINNINKETIASRLDTSSSDSIALGAAPVITTSTSTIPPDLPVDALGNVDLVNRIKTWPREKQPFWYINWRQIQEHRGDSKNRAQLVQTEPNQRSFFAG